MAKAQKNIIHEGHGQFDVILMDAPWWYANRLTSATGERTKFGEGASGQYGCMKNEDLMAIGPLVQAIAAPSAVMLMWVTGPLLPLALNLAYACGFEYSTKAYTWVKINADGSTKGNPGTYTSSNTEDVLLFTRTAASWVPKLTPQQAKGKRMVPQVVEEWNSGAREDITNPANGATEDWPEGTIIIRDRLTEHSRKPDDVHIRTDLMYPTQRKIELFARREYPGWVCLGNEVTGLDIMEDLELAAGGFYDAAPPEEEFVG